MISIASMTAVPLGQHGLQDSRAGRCIVLAGAVFWLGSGSGSGKGNYMAVAEAGDRASADAGIRAGAGILCLVLRVGCWQGLAA